jgi:hypothetical protein
MPYSRGQSIALGSRSAPLASGGESRHHPVVSQYVEAEVAGVTVEELARALAELGLNFQTSPRSGATLMLEGCLESAGRPVHLRLDAGVLDTAEDFGFLTDTGRIRLVCGDVDRGLLATRLLAPMHAKIVEARIRATHHVSVTASAEASEIGDPAIVVRVTED